MKSRNNDFGALFVPEFEMVSNPTIRIAEVKRRHFDTSDTTIRRLAEEYFKYNDSDPSKAAEIFANTFGDKESEG